jgi:hypothetical protein
MKKLLAAMLFLTGAWIACAQTEQAVILEIQGKADIRESGSPDWKPAAEGDIITKGAVISTGFRSTVVISLGASRVTVHPVTALTLEELIRRDGTEEARVFLRSGRVRIDVNRPEGLASEFTVRSPVITASVRGTNFEFDGRRLWVNEGTVLLANNYGQRVYVDEGQRSYIDENNSNRVVPPIETEIASLRPRLPELDRTGRQEPAETTSPSGSLKLVPGWMP